jgi:uncharacterized cysteine cluster protein YcgN (CxxCxxCC family)
MADAPETEPFWKRKSLEEMTRAEWESLCDGCARCCLIKLQDADTDVVSYTDVSCKLLDTDTCRCTKYTTRSKLVPDCITLNSENFRELSWMPSTCAYRLIAEGQDLYWWHPLVSGDPETVHLAGVSVRNRCIPEKRRMNLEKRIVTWPE